MFSLVDCATIHTKSWSKIPIVASDLNRQLLLTSGGAVAVSQRSPISPRYGRKDEERKKVYVEGDDSVELQRRN